MSNLKPFNLPEALAGNAVMLRCGGKAYVRHHETELSTKADETLLGYVDGIGLWSWGLEGESCTTGDETKYDIIGMYPETRVINGFEVPVPETEPLEEGSTYFLISLQSESLCSRRMWCSTNAERLWLSNGLIFLNRWDAVANAKAMMGIDPRSETES